MLREDNDDNWMFQLIALLTRKMRFSISDLYQIHEKRNMANCLYTKKNKLINQ